MILWLRKLWAKEQLKNSVITFEIDTTCRDLEGDGDIMKDSDFYSTGDEAIDEDPGPRINVEIILSGEPVKQRKIPHDLDKNLKPFAKIISLTLYVTCPDIRVQNGVVCFKYTRYKKKKRRRRRKKMDALMSWSLAGGCLNPNFRFVSLFVIIHSALVVRLSA